MPHGAEAMHTPQEAMIGLRNPEHGAEATTAAQQFQKERGASLLSRSLMKWGISGMLAGGALVAAGVFLSPFVPWIPVGIAVVGFEAWKYGAIATGVGGLGTAVEAVTHKKGKHA